MLKATILAVAALALVSAKPVKRFKAFDNPENLGKCIDDCKGLKKGQTSDIFEICPSTAGSGDLHLLCGKYNYTEAAAQCEYRGWRLAIITEENRANAANLTSECMTIEDQVAWIAGFEGLQADPCAQYANYAEYDGILLNLGEARCAEEGYLNVICQDLPVKTITETSGTVTVYYGVSTVTRYVGDSSSSRLNKNAEGRGRSHEHCQHCAKVCKERVDDLRFLDGNFTSGNIEAECGKFGWYPADLTSGDAERVAYLLANCLDTENYDGAWAHSFNGVVSQCLFVEPSGDNNFVAGFPGDSAWCNGPTEKYPVICQKNKPSRVGKGADLGPVSTTTTTIPSPFIIPTATTTVYRHRSSSDDF